jgi:hypothetical protein
MSEAREGRMADGYKTAAAAVTALIIGAGGGSYVGWKPEAQAECEAVVARLEGAIEARQEARVAKDEVAAAVEQALDYCEVMLTRCEGR